MKKYPVHAAIFLCIFVLSQVLSYVAVQAAPGDPLYQWGGLGSGDGQFDRPNQAAVDASGNVYVADTGNNRIQVFSNTGAFLRKWGTYGDGDGQFEGPRGLALDGKGNVYVADVIPDQYRIQVFDSSGNFLRKWSGPANAVRLAPDQNGNIWTDNPEGGTIFQFDPNGNLLRDFGLGEPSRAGGIAVDPGGTVFVTDVGNQRINVFDNSGTFLRSFADGALPAGGAAAATVCNIALDLGGNVFVTNNDSDQILVYDSEGPFKASWGGPGDGIGQYHGPVNVALDTSGSKVFVTDIGNNRIQVLEGYGNAAYSLSGTVRAGSTTGPVLAGATVAIAGKTATTSSTGTFTITGIPAGTYTITISKAGYSTKTITGYVINSNRTGVFYLTAVPTYYLSGTVRVGSSTGPVLAGATVSFAGKTTTTSSTGTFTISGIAAGSYTLTISKPGYVTKTINSYYISSNKSGVVFYLTPLYSLSGTVRVGSSTGPVLAGATVSIAGKTATTSSTGTFTVSDIPAGTYTLTISRTGYVTKTISSYYINSNKSGQVFYLTAQSGYTISGAVHQGSTSGPVLGGATVTIAGKTTTTSSTGAFTVTGLSSGTYAMTISKAGYITKSITLVINGNMSGLSYYLLGPYWISGTVRQGSSSGPVLAGATVSIASRSATTGSTGTFTVTGIPAGTYTLTISKAGYVTKTVTGFTVTSSRTGLIFYLTQ